MYTGKLPEPCERCPTPPVDTDADEVPAGLNLTIENIYDDRGFRLAKINHLTHTTTWYIRDASGNVISIHETNQEGDVVEKEIPIYGSGKIGTYYPEEDGSNVYEITDHLGNVRALLRENIHTYVATMEDNGQEDITNPRVEEMAYFENLFETEKDNEAFMNVTPATTDEPDPRKVAYLFWNDTPGTLAEEKAIGPSWAKRVSAGDKVDAKVWTRYEEKVSYAKDFNLLAFASLLGNTFSTMAGFEGYSLSQTTSSLHTGLLAPTFQDNDADDSRPYAYLNYILYDEEMNVVGASRFRVPETAASDQASLYLPGNEPVEMGFDQTLEIEQNGYLYIWLSNESKEARVWFDDLAITHTEHLVVQATDYGVWGDVIREQKSDIALYRYGYQGQFAEKDDETGWNHFELREYDAVVGRWLSRDIARQFYSPYLGLGNNPISFIDPDGAYSFLGASLRRGWDIVRGKSVGELYDVDGDWGYNKKIDDFEWYFNVGYERDTSGDGILRMALDDAVGKNRGMSPIEAIIARGGDGIEPDLTIESFAIPVFGFLKFANAAKTGGRVFWSGGDDAMNAAMNYAKANGMTTLEMTRAGQNLTKLTQGMPWEQAGPMWQRLSAAYAKGAKGSVHVFQNANTGVRLNSVWRTVEYPILNGKNNIIYHNVFKP